MALKGQISLTFLSVSILALELSLWFSPTVSPTAGEIGARSVSLRPATQLSQPVDPRSSNVVVPDAVLIGVSFNSVGDIPVVQQPAGEPHFVSKNDDEITQFGSANQYGNIGLLAHNYLTGREFSRLSIGEEFHLVYSDGRQERYIVTEILRYRALDSKSPYSSFQNLADKDEVLTVSQMFDRAYQGGRHVTFQTCIAADGNSSWGRLFIIAIPILEDLGYGPSSP